MPEGRLSGKPRTVRTRTSGQHVPALPPSPVTQPPQAPLDTMCWLSHAGGAAGRALTVDTVYPGIQEGSALLCATSLLLRSPRFCH